MAGNGQKTHLKPIAQLYLNVDGKLVINTDEKNPLTLAKWMAQGLSSIIKIIPASEPNKIITPVIQPFKL